MSSRRIAYFYDPDVGNFHYGKNDNKNVLEISNILIGCCFKSSEILLRLY